MGMWSAWVCLLVFLDRGVRVKAVPVVGPASLTDSTTQNTVLSKTAFYIPTKISGSINTDTNVIETPSKCSGGNEPSIDNHTAFKRQTSTRVDAEVTITAEAPTRAVGNDDAPRTTTSSIAFTNAVSALRANYTTSPNVVCGLFALPTAGALRNEDSCSNSSATYNFPQLHAIVDDDPKPLAGTQTPTKTHDDGPSAKRYGDEIGPELFYKARIKVKCSAERVAYERRPHGNHHSIEYEDWPDWPSLGTRLEVYGMIRSRQWACTSCRCDENGAVVSIGKTGCKSQQAADRCAIIFACYCWAQLTQPEATHVGATAQQYQDAINRIPGSIREDYRNRHWRWNMNGLNPEPGQTMRWTNDFSEILEAQRPVVTPQVGWRDRPRPPQRDGPPGPYVPPPQYWEGDWVGEQPPGEFAFLNVLPDLYEEQKHWLDQRSENGRAHACGIDEEPRQAHGSEAPSLDDESPTTTTDCASEIMDEADDDPAS
ncbi:hypothetical protein TWF281_007446 [Arthrobotrys megalospora]